MALLASCVVAAVSVAFSAVAVAVDIAAGDGNSPAVPLRTAAFVTAVIAVAAGGLVGALPAGAGSDRWTPTAVRAFRLSAPPPTVRMGETGVRFPWAPVVSAAGTTFGAAWLSLVLGNLRFPTATTGLIVVMGCGLSVIPITVGVAWWPVLGRVVRGGIIARQLWRIGAAYVTAGSVGGLVTGTAVLALGWRDGDWLPGVLAIAGLGGLVAWRGAVLIGFARRVRSSTPRSAGDG